MLLILKMINALDAFFSLFIPPSSLINLLMMQQMFMHFLSETSIFPVIFVAIETLVLISRIFSLLVIPSTGFECFHTIRIIWSNLLIYFYWLNCCYLVILVWRCYKFLFDNFHFFFESVSFIQILGTSSVQHILITFVNDISATFQSSTSCSFSDLIPLIILYFSKLP